MSNLNEQFVAHAGCMDGRGRQAVRDYTGRDENFLDRVCSGPGAVAGIAAREEFFLEQLRRCLPVTVNKHGTRTVYVHGHSECAGNPIDDETHKQQILEAAEVVREMIIELGLPSDVMVVSLWAERATEGERPWMVEVLSESRTEQVAAE